MTAISSRPVSPSPIMSPATASTHVGASNPVVEQAINQFRDSYLNQGVKRTLAEMNAEVLLYSKGIGRTSPEFQAFSTSVQEIVGNHAFELAKKMVDGPALPGTTLQERIRKAISLLSENSIHHGHPLAEAFVAYADSKGEQSPLLDAWRKPKRSPDPGRNAMTAHIRRNSSGSSSTGASTKLSIEHVGAANMLLDQAINQFKDSYLNKGKPKLNAEMDAEAFLSQHGIAWTSEEFKRLSKAVKEIAENRSFELAKEMLDRPVAPGTTLDLHIQKAMFPLLSNSIAKGHPLAEAFAAYADSQGKRSFLLDPWRKAKESPDSGQTAVTAHSTRNSPSPSLPPPKLKFGSKWSADIPDPARTLSPEIPAAWNLTLAMMSKVDLPTSSNHAFMPGSILQQAVYLAMLSAGEGRAELFRLLGLKNGDINAQLDLIAKNAALSVDDLSHIFGTGSSLWIHDTDAENAKSTLPLFKRQDQMRELGLHTDVADLRKSPEVVNQWADKETGGKISTLLDASELSNADFALTSFNQFKAKWKTAFEPATEPLMFTNSLGEVKAVDGMQHQRISIPAFEGPNFQCFALPYDAGGLDVRAAVFLPHKGTPVDELYRQLSSGTDGGASNSLPVHLAQLGRIEETSCRVTMPAFLSESQTNVRNTLCNLKADALFNPRKTNFSPIFGEGNRPHVELTVMKDKTAIKFDREGTEAVSAAASVGGSRSSIPVLKVDRPFMVVIYTAFGADDMPDVDFPWPLAVTMVNDPGSSK